MNEQQRLVHKAVGSLKWSAMMEIVSRTAQPVVVIVLAKLLVPEDFGIVGTAMIVISFSRMFLDAGLGKALVQTNLVAGNAANVVFWTNITLGGLIYVVIFVSAPALAGFFNSSASGPVIRVLGLQLIILSLTSVQEFLFIRNMGFRDLFWAKLAMAAMPGLFSIPLASFGFGVWALVAGTLVGSFVNMLILWSKSPWRPSFSYDLAIARQLFRFGFWIVLEGLGIWLIGWGDQLLVGRFLSVAELGVYRVGWYISTVLFGLTFNPLLPVMYSTFSRLQEDREELKRMFHKIVRIMITFILPIAVGVPLIAPELTDMVFGDKWEGLGFVLAFLTLLGGAGAVVAANPELYRSVGRPDVNTKVLVFTLAFYLPAYLIAVQYGLTTFVVVRTLLAFFALPVHVFFVVRIFGFSPVYLWRDGRKPINAGILMLLAVFCLKKTMYYVEFPSSELLKVLALVLVGAATYSVVLWYSDKEFCRSVVSLFQRAIRGTKGPLSPAEAAK